MNMFWCRTDRLISPPTTGPRTSANCARILGLVRQESRSASRLQLAVRGQPRPYASRCRSTEFSRRLAKPTRCLQMRRRSRTPASSVPDSCPRRHLAALYHRRVVRADRIRASPAAARPPSGFRAPELSPSGACHEPDRAEARRASWGAPRRLIELRKVLSSRMTSRPIERSQYSGYLRSSTAVKAPGTQSCRISTNSFDRLPEILTRLASPLKHKLGE